MIDALVGAECIYCHGKIEYIESTNTEVLYGCRNCNHEWKLTEVEN